MNTGLADRDSHCWQSWDGASEEELQTCGEEHSAAHWWLRQWGGSWEDTGNLHCLGMLSRERCHTMELAAQSVIWGVLGEAIQSCHFDKVLREASSSWTLLVALCYQNWELGELPSAGARQRRKLHPARGSAEPTLRRTQEAGRENSFLLRCLSGTLYWRNSIPNVTGKIFTQPTLIITEQAKMSEFGAENQKNWWPAQNSLSSVCFVNISPKLWLAFSFS